VQAKPELPEIPMPPAAIGIALFSFFCFSLLDSSAKWLVVGGQAVVFVVWVRFTIQAVTLFAFYRGWSNPRLWTMQRPVLQIIRGLLLPVMTGFNFLSLQYLQLAETISVLLASPIILYDRPAIAPESAGDFCDATEIDEMLTLRMLTLTDEERRQAERTDAKSRAIIERTFAQDEQAQLALHGARRQLPHRRSRRACAPASRADQQTMRPRRA